MRKLVAGIALVGLLGTAQPGQTQDYPARPVTMIPRAPVFARARKSGSSPRTAASESISIK